MHKKSLFVSILMLSLALIVCIVGVTAAWFGNTVSVSRVMEITSAQPSGNATIVVESGSSGYLSNDKVIYPAKLRAGYALADRTGTDLVVPYTYYPVDGTNTPTTVDAGNDLYNASTNASGAFEQAALAVSMTFDFTYSGEPMYSGDATTQAVITLTSATLTNPRTTPYVLMTSAEAASYTGWKFTRTGTGTTEDPYVYTRDDANGTYRLNGLPDYKSEFTLVMSVTCDDAIGDDTLDPTYRQPPSQTGQALSLRIKSGPIYSFHVIVYFAHSDEETSPVLKDTRVFLNFELTIN